MIQLDEVAIDRTLPDVKIGLNRYCVIQKLLNETDASTDGNFQKIFNGFYRVRRNVEWRTVYFKILQEERSHKRPFCEILKAIYNATGRVEASFASKLLATVDPEMPVIDSIVLKNLGLKLPPRHDITVRLREIRKVYDEIIHLYAEFLRLDAGSYLVTQFGKHYPEHPITKVKMLDLVLWKTTPHTIP